MKMPSGAKNKAGWGGARPGAGRKPGPKPEPAVVPGMDPLAFLEGVMRGLIEATPLQVRAAVAAAQYRHTKRADGGKKEEAAERAKKASDGKFSVRKPPLRVVGG